MSTETVGLSGTGARDGHLDFHTAPELWIISVVIPPPCYGSSKYKVLVILPKVQVAGYS